MADSKTTPLSLNDLGLEAYQGVSKKSGKPYTALRFKVSLNGDDYSTLVFVNKVNK